MKKFCRVLPVFLLIIMLSFTGCGKNKSADSEYKVYFTNTAANKLVDVSYQPENTSTLALVRELIEQMNTRQKQDDCVVIKPDNVKIDNTTYNESKQEVDISLSREYNECSNGTRLLFNAALVKTLTQLDGVEYVMLYVDNAQAQYADGTPVGLLSSDDFVDDSAQEMGSVEWKNLNLYYANRLGDKLVSTTVTVAYSKNVSLEKMIVEKLIKGPSDSSLYATLPSDLKLLNVSVNNGVCYVNLDSGFLTEMVNVSSEIPIYSIVNSLCALDSVDSVKIMVNGDSSKTFRESISLENTFSFNDNIIER
jgi:germination protein M